MVDASGRHVRGPHAIIHDSVQELTRSRFQFERIIDANAFGSQNSAAQNHIEETLYKREGIAINQGKSSFHSLASGR